MPLPHISVCICTFKRPALLTSLLRALTAQQTAGLFTYGVVISDNDAMQSAKPTVESVRSEAGLDITYCAEPRQNIALARNRALENARGEFIAFIDDDEVPEADWLLRLFETRVKYQVDGVLGPVKPRFESEPPAWVTKGKFFDRPTYPTGRKIQWPEARSGNVLFSRSILDGVETPFNPEFATAGEDVDFFRRMSEKGYRFVWCNEAVAHELLPASRCTRRYLLRRAALRGSNFHKHPSHRVRNAVKSVIAVPAYIVALPVLAILGHHFFLTYLIKLLDHASRLLAYVGLSLVTERET